MATSITRQESVFHERLLPNGLRMLGQHMPDVQSAPFWTSDFAIAVAAQEQLDETITNADARATAPDR